MSSQKPVTCFNFLVLPVFRHFFLVYLISGYIYKKADIDTLPIVLWHKISPTLIWIFFWIEVDEEWNRPCLLFQTNHFFQVVLSKTQQSMESYWCDDSSDDKNIWVKPNKECVFEIMNKNFNVLSKFINFEIAVLGF